MFCVSCNNCKCSVLGGSRARSGCALVFPRFGGTNHLVFLDPSSGQFAGIPLSFWVQRWAPYRSSSSSSRSSSTVGLPVGLPVVVVVTWVVVVVVVVVPWVSPWVSKPNGKPTKYITDIVLLVGSRGGVLLKQLLTNVSLSR